MFGFIATSTIDSAEPIFVGPFETESARSLAVTAFWDGLDALNRELGLEEHVAIGAELDFIQRPLLTGDFVTVEEAVKRLRNEYAAEMEMADFRIDMSVHDG